MIKKLSILTLFWCPILALASESVNVDKKVQEAVEYAKSHSTPNYQSPESWVGIATSVAQLLKPSKNANRKPQVKPQRETNNNDLLDLIGDFLK